MDQNIPPGFKPLSRRSAFLDLIGPIYCREKNSHGKDQGLVIAIRGEDKHCNARGKIHGGVLCTLADIALGYNSALAADKPSSRVTTTLSIDFVSGAKKGDWIEIEVDVQKVGRALAFANCYFWVDKKRIARANASFYDPSSK